MPQTLLFIVLLTLVTGVGGLALGGGLATLFKRESPRPPACCFPLLRV